MSALDLFWRTIAVVCGILTPVILLLVLRAFLSICEEESERRKYKAKRDSERGPYTRAVFFKVPNERMLGVYLYDGERIAHTMSGEKP